jgi:hypothetical protein
MKKFILFAALAALLAPAVYSQNPTGAPVELKGDVWTPLGTTLKARFTRGWNGPKLPTDAVKVKGNAMFAMIEFQATKSATVSYKTTPDDKSDIYLVKDGQKIAPIAVMEDFPSWGEDNDKEVELLTSRNSPGSTTLNFSQTGWLNILFDVPLEQMKPPQNFKLMVRSLKANNQTYSFAVSL